MNLLKEYLKVKLINQLNEGVPLAPLRFGAAVGGTPQEQMSASKQRARRLIKMQRLGEKRAEAIIYGLHEKIPGLYKAHLKTQLSGNFGDFESPTGAVQDANMYIDVARMIANHPEGGHKHATRYLHAASMYQLGLPTEYGYPGEGDPFMTKGFKDYPGANIEREDKGGWPHGIFTATERGKEAGDKALRMMSAARARLRGYGTV
jgi:hypothetical protein